MIESYLGSEQSMIGPIIEGSEEAAAQYLEISAQPPLKSTKHRHSVHTSNVHQLQINSAQFDKANRSNGQFLKHVSLAAAFVVLSNYRAIYIHGENMVGSTLDNYPG
ncbi:hypothetical protein Y032_0411g968 [Ancylostoma ceylanicum]|nr:hypothetical protein Y032_0411g968 [Ancylostoma ceylanicum]